MSVTGLDKVFCSKVIKRSVLVSLEKASYIACLSALPFPVASFFALDGSMTVTGTPAL